MSAASSPVNEPATDVQLELFFFARAGNTDEEEELFRSCQGSAAATQRPITDIVHTVLGPANSRVIESVKTWHGKRGLYESDHC